MVVTDLGVIGEDVIAIDGFDVGRIHFDGENVRLSVDGANVGLLIGIFEGAKLGLLDIGTFGIETTGVGGTGLPVVGNSDVSEFGSEIDNVTGLPVGKVVIFGESGSSSLLFDGSFVVTSRFDGLGVEEADEGGLAGACALLGAALNVVIPVPSFVWEGHGIFPLLPDIPLFLVTPTMIPTIVTTSISTSKSATPVHESLRRLLLYGGEGVAPISDGSFWGAADTLSLRLGGVSPPSVYSEEVKIESSSGIMIDIDLVGVIIGAGVDHEVWKARLSSFI